MPKRRLPRTARQTAASRRNLEKARKAKSRNTIPQDSYSGKISAYHRTSPEAATSILKNGFSTANSRTGQKAEVFFSTKLHSGLTRIYGPAVIKAKLSPSQLRRYGWSYKPSFGKGNWHSLPVSQMHGVKLKRILVTKTERKPKGGK